MTHDDIHCQVALWRQRSVKQRCHLIGNVATAIAGHADELISEAATDQRTDVVETITGELYPLCAALRFIDTAGPRILRTQHVGLRGRPLWLWGVRSQIDRVPYGDVLILGTWNYPLFLVGVQAAQALAGGNRVLIKPAQGCESITQKLLQAFYDSGIPQDDLIQLDSSIAAATEAIDRGVDLIVMTGSSRAGRSVMQRAAESLTPLILELSGCDAMVILPSADLDRVADAVAFGLTFNGGATCIAPRRLLVTDAVAAELIPRLRARISQCPSIAVHQSARSALISAIDDAFARGAEDCLGEFRRDELVDRGVMRPLVLDQVPADATVANSDLFGPIASIIRVHDFEQTIQCVNQCPYGLAASLFGDEREAKRMAKRLDVGFVTINDLIVPTADPRLPFGGRRASGFGVTRGTEGLLAMTRPQVISVRRGRFFPHLNRRSLRDAPRLLKALKLLYGAWKR